MRAAEIHETPEYKRAVHLPSHVQLQQVHPLPDLFLLQQRDQNVSAHHPNLSVHAIHLFLRTGDLHSERQQLHFTTQCSMRAIPVGD